MEPKWINKKIAGMRKIEATKFLKDRFNLSLSESKTYLDDIDTVMTPNNTDSVHHEKFFEMSTKSQREKFKLIFGGIFSLIGAGLLAGSLYLIINDYSISKDAIEITGKVISDPSRPLFEYENNGQIHTYQSRVTSEPPSFDLGEEVEILINPNFPNKPIINTFIERWFEITILGSLGIVFFSIGLSAAIFLKKPGQ